MQINRQTLDAIKKNFVSLYDASFGAAKPLWNNVAMHVPSTTASNVYGWLGASTRIREWVGDRVIQNLKSHDFEIKNKDWEDTISVERNAILDDSLGVYTPMISQLGQDAANFPDELVFGLLAAAFTTTCYDGQYLVDTDHPVLDENGNVTSVSNHGGGSGAAWFLIDDTKMVKPIIFQERSPFNFVAKDDARDDNVFFKKEYIYGVDARMNVGTGLWQLIFGSKQTLDSTSYAAARTAMGNFKGDNGRPLRVQGSLLVTGPSNETAARKLLEAESDANGATNIHRNTARLIVVPELG